MTARQRARDRAADAIAPREAVIKCALCVRAQRKYWRRWDEQRKARR